MFVALLVVKVVFNYLSNSDLIRRKTADRNRQFSFEFDLTHNRISRRALQARHIAVSYDVCFHFGKPRKRYGLPNAMLTTGVSPFQNFIQNFLARFGQADRIFRARTHTPEKSGNDNISFRRFFQCVFDFLFGRTFVNRNALCLQTVTT